MSCPNVFKILLFSMAFVAGTACSQSEAQQQFEAEALQPPSGITAMNANGFPAEDGESDPDDWRTAPDFSGLFEVSTSAFPNPVSFNSSFEILIDVKGIDAIDGLFVYAFRQTSDIPTANPLEIRQGTLQPGQESIVIRPQEFARSGGTGTIGNEYRIIFYNGQREVITYGDVLVD
jgi:hypothetical protein